MRVWAALCVLLLAGCASPRQEAPDPDANTTAPTLPTADLTVEVPPPLGEKLPRVVETFTLTADKALTTQGGASSARAAANNRPQPFLMSSSGDFQVEAWVSEPFRVAYEFNDASELVLSFSSDSPAPGLGASGLSPQSANVFAWIGTPERYAVGVAFPDAPASLEAGKTYTVRASVPQAKDLFLREGEQLAIRPVMMYDGQGPFSWVVGDANLSGLRLDHQHFNVSAPVATIVVDEGGSYECQPNAPSVSFDLAVPVGTVFLVVDMAITSSVPGHLDVDLAITSGGERIATGTGPNAKETVVLGPAQLATGGPFVATWPCPTPSGTFSLKAVAHGPAAVAS